MGDFVGYFKQLILVIEGNPVYLEENGFFDALRRLVTIKRMGRTEPFDTSLALCNTLISDADSYKSVDAREKSIIYKTEASDIMAAASELFTDFMNCDANDAFPYATPSEQDWKETVKTDLAVMLVAGWREKYQDNNQYLTQVASEHAPADLVPKPGYAVCTFDTEVLFDEFLKYSFMALDLVFKESLAGNKQLAALNFLNPDELYGNLSREMSSPFREFREILGQYKSNGPADLYGWPREATYLVSARCPVYRDPTDPVWDLRLRKGSNTSQEDLDLALNRLRFMPERRDWFKAKA